MHSLNKCPFIGCPEAMDAISILLCSVHCFTSECRKWSTSAFFSLHVSKTLIDFCDFISSHLVSVAVFLSSLYTAVSIYSSTHVPSIGKFQLFDSRSRWIARGAGCTRTLPRWFLVSLLFGTIHVHSFVRTHLWSQSFGHEASRLCKAKWSVAAWCPLACLISRSVYWG